MSEGKNPFEVLEISPSFIVDKEHLDQAYFAKQRLWHPDRFVGQSPEAQEKAAHQATRLNEAYKILQNPLLRAEALLKIADVDLEPIHDPEFLEQMMEWQMRITSDESDRQEFQKKCDDLYRTFAESFEQTHYDEAAAIYHKLCYMDKMLSNTSARET